MKRNTLWGILASGLLIVVLAAGVAAALAQTGAGYDLTWSTVDGGGAASTGGGFSLSGTAGQPEAAVSTGGGYTLEGGYWVATAANFRMFLPVTMRP